MLHQDFRRALRLARIYQAVRNNDPAHTVQHKTNKGLGGLNLSAPDEVIFLSTRDAYAPYYADAKPKYYEPSKFYAEFAKSWQQRRLPMRYAPRDDIIDVYRLWRERNAGAQGGNTS